MRQGLFASIRTSIFWTKLTHWEFWPFNIIYFPVLFYWLWLSLKSRSFFFFSTSNPGIEYSGMLGESKFKIHNSLPEEYVPITIYIQKNNGFSQVKDLMVKNGLNFPVILKPDIGERGWMVEKINSEKELKKYVSVVPVDFLVQEYIDLSIELGVFYYRYPNKDRGRISSIVKKKMLKITGTGKDTVKDLMKQDIRGRLQIPVFKKAYPEILERVPENGKTIELMPIGNHARGTAFLNESALINEELSNVFDDISKKIEGFYFGRFDIRCNTEKNLYNGDFKIMELNGAGAEPGHIYHPGSSLFAAYSAIFSHLNALYEISRQNRKNGIKGMSFKEGLKFIRKVRNYNKLKSGSKEDLS